MTAGRRNIHLKSPNVCIVNDSEDDRDIIEHGDEYFDSSCGEVDCLETPYLIKDFNCLIYFN